jgi:hypothetical protein
VHSLWTLTLLAAVVGCGGGTLGTPGTAGTVGTGQGGAGGDGLPACGNNVSGASDVVYLMIYEQDGRITEGTVDGLVTVASISPCTVATCGDRALAPASLLVLSDGAQKQWTVVLGNTAMPPDVIYAGEEFTVAINAFADDTSAPRLLSQTFMLLRDGNLVVFAASLGQYPGVPVPRLDPFGIVMADYGAICEGAVSAGCVTRPHSIRLTIGPEGATVGIGQTLRMGGFSFTNGDFSEVADAGSCATPRGTTKVAVFRLPAP